MNQSLIEVYHKTIRVMSNRRKIRNGYIGMKRVEKRDLYNIKYFLFLSIAICIISFVSVIYIDNYIIRYSLLLISLIYIFVKYGKKFI